MLMIGALTLPVAGCGAMRGMRDSDHWLAGIIEPIMPPSPAEAARDAVNVYDADRRRRAIALLGDSPFGHEQTYVRLYRLLIDDPDPTVRAACAKALGQHGDVSDVELLLPLLRDEDAFARWEAAKALQRLHHPGAAMPLVQTLGRDEDADVRMAAAMALGQYAQPAVFEALIGAMMDPDYGVAHAARISLTLLTGTDQGPLSSDWLAWSRQLTGSRFADQQPYTFQPYYQPPGFLQRMQVWKQHEKPQPQQPRGLEVAAEMDTRQ